MLKGISSLLNPDLLKLLCEMGHGDELVLADSNFPGTSVANQLVRADGPIAPLLDAILTVFPLDNYAAPLIMMQAVAGDILDPARSDRHHRSERSSRFERNAGKRDRRSANVPKNLPLISEKTHFPLFIRAGGWSVCRSKRSPRKVAG